MSDTTGAAQRLKAGDVKEEKANDMRTVIESNALVLTAEYILEERKKQNI